MTSSPSTDPSSVPVGGPLQLLIVQPTPFCNIDCDYCYLPERSNKSQMSMETLERTLREVNASGLVRGEYTIVWHAGEPLVLPIAYYEQAFALVEACTPKGVQVRHSFQSNGMLLTPEWCEFIQRHHVGIGLSIDGPPELHDARRKTRSGKGTHATAMRGLGLLREHGIDFHVISVLTRRALGFPDELFEFYEDNGVRRVAFNVEEIEGCNTASSLNAAQVERSYRAFMHRFWQLVHRRPPGTMIVREFGEALNSVLRGPNAQALDQQNIPWTILSVDHTGNFATYSPELLGLKSEHYGDFNLGNLMNESLFSERSRQRLARLDADVRAGVDLCRERCEYFAFCGGGAPSNKYFENGSFRSTETLYCRLTKKALLDVVVSEIGKRPPGESAGATR